MRILVTNDDGINAPGLIAVEKIAHQLAGPDGEVWVIAPAFEQSGVSHAISYVRPMRLQKFDTRRFAIEGTPADCVLAGLGEVLKDTPPDLILSGVNRGHNVAEDTLYSGTIGAAMEAAMHGHRAIAMSQYFSPGNADLDDPFEAATEHAAKIIQTLLDTAPWQENRYGVFYNLNFPPCPAAKVKGTKATFQGHRTGPSFSIIPQTAPNGRKFLWLGHGHGNDTTENGSDAKETMQGYATVTPLRADLSAHELVSDLQKLLDEY